MLIVSQVTLEKSLQQDSIQQANTLPLDQWTAPSVSDPTWHDYRAPLTITSALAHLRTV